MGESLRRSPPRVQTQRLGVFVLEGHPLALRRYFDSSTLGGLTLREVWRDSLERIKDTCFDYEMEAIFLQMPPPNRSIGRVGYEIHDSLVKTTQRTVESMDGTATLLDVTDMLDGHSPEPFIADDNMHPNARGHELIFRNLLSIVYEKFTMTPQDALPDPAEVLDPAYAL